MILKLINILNFEGFITINVKIFHPNFTVKII